MEAGRAADRPAPALICTRLSILLVAGCASENIYEGLKSREELQNPSSDRVPGPKLPSYQDYETERKKLRGGQ